MWRSLIIARIVSDDLQAKPTMSSIVKKYEQIIVKLQIYFESNTKDSKNLATLKKIYSDHVIKDIERVNGKLKIVMDNEFAVAIMNKVNQCEKTYGSDFAKLEASIIFLNFLTQVVDEAKFISIRERRKLEDKIKAIKGSRNFKLNSRLGVLTKSDDKQDFRTELFYILGEDYEDDDEDRAIQIYEKFYKQSLDHNSLHRKVFIKIDSLISKFQNRLEILGPELVAKVDEYFGQEIGKSDKQMEINNILISIAQEQSLQSNQEHLAMLNQMYQQIRKVLNKFSAMRLLSETLKVQLHLARFGSIISGFATRNTDMDLTIITNCYINEIQMLEFLQSFLKAEFKEKKGMKCDIRIIKSARIPLLKLKLQTSKGSAAIDLIINNILGVINSKFLSIYGSIPWIRHLGVLIKLWAKGKDLVEEQKFSSYSLNLMLLHFLLQTGRIKLIMDARQRGPNTPNFIYHRKVRDQQQKFPVYFNFKTNPDEVTKLKRVNLYELLTQFFSYFGQDGKHWKFSKQESIITVDGSKAKQFEQSYIFTIKDPFDEKHNPGRVPANLKNLIDKHFDIALKTLQSLDKDDITKLF